MMTTNPMTDFMRDAESINDNHEFSTEDRTSAMMAGFVGYMSQSQQAEMENALQGLHDNQGVHY